MIFLRALVRCKGSYFSKFCVKNRGQIIFEKWPVAIYVRVFDHFAKNFMKKIVKKWPFGQKKPTFENKNGQ